MTDRAFFDDVSRRLACDVRRADALTFTVFHVLRVCLSPKEIADVAAQLPPVLRRLWAPGGPHGRERLDAAEFVGRVRWLAALPDDREAERAVLAVFAALQHALGSPTGLEGEAWDVWSQLPKGLKHLWMRAGLESSLAAPAGMERKAS